MTRYLTQYITRHCNEDRLRAQTLLKLFEREKVDGGHRDLLTSSERQRIKALEREVWVMRRANKILKPTGTFFCPSGV